MIDKTITFEQLITHTKPYMEKFLKDNYQGEFILKTVRVDYIKHFEDFNDVAEVDTLEAEPGAYDRCISVTLYGEKGWLAPKAFVFYVFKKKESDVKDTEAVEQ